MREAATDRQALAPRGRVEPLVLQRLRALEPLANVTTSMSSSLSLELRAGLGTRLASPLADGALVVVSMNDDSVAIAVDGGR